MQHLIDTGAMTLGALLPIGCGVPRFFLTGNSYSVLFRFILRILIHFIFWLQICYSPPWPKALKF